MNAALNCPSSQRAQDGERLKIAIKAAHVQLARHMGRCLQPELAAQGFEAGRDRFVRQRRELGLRREQRRRFKARTNSKHVCPVASNLLEQTFAPTGANEA